MKRHWSQLSYSQSVPQHIRGDVAIPSHPRPWCNYVSQHFTTHGRTLCTALIIFYHNYNNTITTWSKYLKVKNTKARWSIICKKINFCTILTCKQHSVVFTFKDVFILKTFYTKTYINCRLSEIHSNNLKNTCLFLILITFFIYNILVT